MIFLVWPLSLSSNQQTITFKELLIETGLVYLQPDGFFETAIKDNELLSYEKAIIADDAQVEVRYALRPLSRMTVDYEDPHNAAPEPNHMFSMMFTALIGNLSLGGNSPHREYTLEQARQKFNADWAALSLFDLEPGYSDKFKQAFLLAIHKNNLSDAYMVILFNDYKVVKHRLDHIMSSLSYERRL